MARSGVVASLLIFGILVFMSAGCGGSKRTLRVEYVEGVVTLDGKPVSGASVTFLPVERVGTMEEAGGYTNEAGKFKLSSLNGDPERGAVAGEYHVLVTKIESEDLTKGKPYGAPTGYAVNYRQTHLLPQVYKSANTTPFKLSVKKGNNKINLELKSTP